MRGNVFVVSALLMFAAIGLPGFLKPHDPVWEKRVFRLAWIMFVLGLIGGILSCGDWPRGMPIDGGS